MCELHYFCKLLPFVNWFFVCTANVSINNAGNLALCREVITSFILILNSELDAMSTI